MDNSEQKMIAGCLAGDPAAHRVLYQRYAGKMLALCRRYISNSMEAEDVLQEGFMIVFDKLEQFKHEGSFEGWIRKIMVHKSIQHFRKNPGLYALLDIDDQEDLLISSNDILECIAAKDLLTMIQELPPGYRIVFNLYAIEGYRHREIAEILGISEGTSKSNLSDARRLLKKMIDQRMSVAKAVNS